MHSKYIRKNLYLIFVTIKVKILQSSYKIRYERSVSMSCKGMSVANCVGTGAAAATWYVCMQASQEP